MAFLSILTHMNLFKDVIFFCIKIYFIRVFLFILFIHLVDRYLRGSSIRNNEKPGKVSLASGQYPTLDGKYSNSSAFLILRSHYLFSS